MIPITRVAIVGCGWLGTALAQQCLRQGVATVKGSSRQSGRLLALRQQGIEAHELHLPALNPGALRAFLEADVCVFSLSPRTPHYLDALQQVCDLLPKTSRLILLSATSVYPDNGAEVDEDTPIHATHTGNPLQWQAEKLVHSQVDAALVVRLGGLMGYDRFLLKYFMNKDAITGGHTPVNHVHRDDAVSILVHLMSAPTAHGTFNAVAPLHPPKRAILEAQARQLGITLPPWAAPHKQAHKKVVPKRLLQQIGYQFIYPDPVLFPFVYDKK
ncbi:MAG: NAD(P)-dependent oxidoreductase [Thermonema sp.]|uniref:NAD(P)-binding domain-containing protein n=1 Tax=Thermonema sp. TaxID=2231181 RepID=UPI0021DD55AA|nr:NAD(P)-binding domain-containing protein [Thermonema sp.]GIV39084.1 MAG: NAD(P)-dependent oxidoreductase [Thermonema sp.]